MSDPEDIRGSVRQALLAWRVQTPLPAGFGHEVWRRIERRESESARAVTWGALWQAASSWLLRPGIAACYLGVLLFAGISLGWWQAQREAANLKQDLARRCVQSVDPYQALR